MQSRFSVEAPTSLEFIGDTDDIEESKPSSPSNEQADSAEKDPFNRVSHPRVQFIRLTSVARTGRGTPGTTPPFQPAAPSLFRSVDPDQLNEPAPTVIARDPSPLRTLALSNYSSTVGQRYDSSPLEIHDHLLKCRRRGRMPHAVSMPHSGFQALILCGPGIGLSTFTSVPVEFPKALVEIANRPMVWYVLDWCYRMGVTDITLITPPASKQTIRSALAQNPHLTSLPSPSPDLLAPADLEHTTPTAELLRLPEVQKIISSDFLLLPCDMICDISGEGFLETYLTSLAGLGGIGTFSEDDYSKPKADADSLGGEQSGRRGGLSIWYNTANREESVKKEECDFMCTAKLDSQNSQPLSTKKASNDSGTMRKLVWTMPMSELWDQIEEDKDKSWKIRQSLLRKHGHVKCMTQYRDSHIYFFPYWVKDFARINDEFESVSEDLVGTLAKAEWRKPGYRARFGVQKILTAKPERVDDRPRGEIPIEEEIDLLSLSSTQVTLPTPVSPVAQQKRTAQLASRVRADPEDSILSAESDATETALESIPPVPPILAYILPSTSSAPLVRRVDTTPLLLSVSLLVAKTPSIEDSAVQKQPASPFAHAQKVASTAAIAPRVTISRSDTLIGSNAAIATQCVVKNSCIGSNVSLGAGSRVTGCVIMDGTSIGEKCVLTGTVIGKKVKIGSKCQLTNCEVQDANMLGDGVEGKGEKYLVGGLEDDVDGEGMDFDDKDEGEDSESPSMEG